jgi:hypothetical protein
MGVITLEVVEKDGVGEIPVVASQVTMGMGGPQVLRCGMLVVVVADLVRELELLLAYATIFNLPMLILLLGGKDGQIVDVQMPMSLFATVLDILAESRPELNERLPRFSNLANLLEDLVTMVLGPNQLVKAVGEEIVNHDGRLRSEILKVIGLLIHRNKRGLEICVDGAWMVPSLQIVHILELNGHIDRRHNLHSPILRYMTPMIVVSFQLTSTVEQMRACQTGELLALLSSPSERPDVENSGEVIEKSTIIPRST